MSIINSPGPASYATLKYNSIGGSQFVGVGARGSTFGSRTKTIRICEPTPGPGSYNASKDLGTHVKVHPVRKSAAFSMGLKLAPTQDVYSSTPGPGGYEIYRPGTVGTGHHKTLSARPPVFDQFNNPGPAHYHPDLIKASRDSAPLYSMRKKTEVVRPSTSPGPGAYETRGDMSRSTPTSYQTTRGKTMSARTPTSHRTAYPGPGAYTPNKIEKCQPHAPVYSMAAHCGARSDYASSTNPMFTKAQLGGTNQDVGGMGEQRTQMAQTRPMSAAGQRLDALPQGY